MPYSHGVMHILMDGQTVIFRAALQMEGCITSAVGFCIQLVEENYDEANDKLKTVSAVNVAVTQSECISATESQAAAAALPVSNAIV